METIEELQVSLFRRICFDARSKTMTQNQLENYNVPFSDEVGRLLQQMEDGAAKERKIEMYGRALYFRRCSWHQYLLGHTDKPPIEPIKNAQY